MENNPKSDGTIENCCCSLPIVIRQNDANFIACDKNLRDVDKCYSCIESISHKPIKVYANSRNYWASELMLPFRRDYTHSTPNLTKSKAKSRSNSQQNERRTPLSLKNDHCVDCLSPKCKPLGLEDKGKKEEWLSCESALCPDNMKSLKPEPDLTGENTSAIKKAVLKETNRYRRMHCACPLRLDDELSAYAQEWAEHLATEDLLETRPIPIYGENIMCVLKSLFCVERLMKLWYQEKYNYDFLRPCFNLYSGHFTQMVWWETQLLGVGMASNDYRLWIVCNYQPAGNIRGHFKENVLPRKMFLSDSDIETDKIEKSSRCRNAVNLRKPCESTKTFKLAREDKTPKPVTG